MEPAALVSAGAICGALTRWRISRSASPSWPATAAINIGGSACLGLLAGYASDRAPRALLLAGTGFMGSFTTFSTFSLDVVLLVEQGSVLRAAGLAFGTPALGIAAAAAGLAAGRRLFLLQTARRAKPI